jgi:hypothetical protein
VGGAIKKKGIKALNIENEMEDCEECAATLSFYVMAVISPKSTWW